MQIHDELLVMSDRELEKALPKDKFKAKYLTDGNYSCKILSKTNKYLQIQYPNKGITITENELYKNIFYLNPLKIEDVKLERANSLMNKIRCGNSTQFGKYLKTVLLGYTTEDKFDIQIDSDCIDVIIYFPEIAITNSVESKHTMKDVYVRHRFILDNDSWVYSRVGLVRTTFTNVEYAANYVFSHLNPDTRFRYDSNFCYGDNTEVKNLLTKIKDGKLLLFKQFLFLFESYLGWESLEGTPYKYIEKLNDYNNLYRQYNLNIDFNIVKQMVETVIVYLDSISYIYKLDDYYTVTLDSGTIEDIDGILTKHWESYNYYLVNNTSTTKRDPPILPNNLTNETILFKGEKKRFKIIQEDSTLAEPPKRIHRQYLTKVLESIKDEFEEFLINKTINI